MRLPLARLRRSAPPGPPRPGLLAVLLAVLVAGLAPGAAWAQPAPVPAPVQPSILDPASPSAADMSGLFWVIFWMAVAVFVAVEGLILYAAVRYKRRPGDAMPPQFHDSTKVEIAWTIAPVIIVLAIAVVSQQKIMAAYSPPAEALQIDVIGKQWFWKYVYDTPIEGGREGQTVTTATELVVPVNTPVRLNMSSTDVLHSFWAPQLSGKQDAEPGDRYGGWEQPFIWFIADREGAFEGQCAELCGTQHAGMRLQVRVLSQADYDAWLANESRPAVQPRPGSAEARGRELVSDPKNLCLGCHTIYGNETMVGDTGPNLTHVAARNLMAGGVFERTDDKLHQWIRDPDSLKYGSKMVLTGVELTDGQIDDIVAYLQSLK
jgi:cytochrome c oxidase subunit 2